MRHFWLLPLGRLWLDDEEQGRRVSLRPARISANAMQNGTLGSIKVLVVDRGNFAAGMRGFRALLRNLEARIDATSGVIG
jgi:hypothetical protein